MAPHPSSRPPPVFSELETEACIALFRFQFQSGHKRPKRPRTCDGLVESLPFSWTSKRRRTQRFHVPDSDNTGEEPQNAEVTEAPAEVTKEKPPVVIRKIRIIGRPEKAAMEGEPVFKAPPPPVGFVGSPTSPLIHGSVSLSSQGEPSDSINSGGAQDHPLAPKLQFRVGTKAEVHSSPNNRGPKKKMVAELKERVNEQLMLKEELEKERKMLVDRHESLMNENKSLKEQLALKSEGKEEDKLFLCSFNSSQKTMLPHSKVKHSSSARVLLPDLNIALEESSDNSSGDFDNRLFKTDKLVAAAHARKYRVDYLRYKQLQFGNVQSK